MRARTHKAHFMTHKYGVWILKKSKFGQNSLLEEFVPVVCIPTKNFVRQLITDNVLRYVYYHLVLPGTIMIKQDQQIRKYHHIS